MKRILNFVLLDVLSVRSGFGFKMLIFFAVLSVVGYVDMGVEGIAFGAVFIIYNICIQPFAAGTNGLDRFYSTLLLSRKSVVIGRYFFVFLTMASIALLYFTIGLIFSIVTNNAITLNHLPVILGVYFVSNLLISISLPLVFKLGYKKAKPLTHFLPLLTIMLILLINNQSTNGIEHIIMQALSRFDGLPSGMLILILFFLV